MSSTNFTRIENTTVSGTALLGSLSANDVKSLNFNSNMVRNPIINLTTAAATYALKAADLVQAAYNVQLVNAATGNILQSDDAILSIGTDTSSQAAAYINLFDLASGVDNKILLNFQIEGFDVGTNISLANQGTTGASKCYTTTGATNNSWKSLMFPNTSTSGTRATVEVYATNVTEGSEVVVFNLVSARGL